MYCAVVVGDPLLWVLMYIAHCAGTRTVCDRDDFVCSCPFLTHSFSDRYLKPKKGSAPGTDPVRDFLSMVSEHYVFRMLIVSFHVFWPGFTLHL